MNCWRCGNETTKDDLPHLCAQCQKMMQTKYDVPDEPKDKEETENKEDAK